MHAPWYSSNDDAHRGTGGDAMEPLLLMTRGAGVDDVVFEGHVHAYAYERLNRPCNDITGAMADLPARPSHAARHAL